MRDMKLYTLVDSVDEAYDYIIANVSGFCSRKERWLFISIAQYLYVMPKHDVKFARLYRCYLHTVQSRVLYYLRKQLTIARFERECGEGSQSLLVQREN